MKTKIMVSMLVVLLIGLGICLWSVSAKSAEVGRLKAGIAERDGIIEQKNADLIEYGAKIKDLERQVKDAQSRIKEQDGLIAAGNTKIAELQQGAAKDQTRITERDKKIDEKNTQLMELGKKLDELTVRLNRGEGLRSPTYQEVIDFVAMDVTNKHEYLIPSYQIIDFAANLNNSAEKWGFRAATVYLKFKSYQPWYLVVFQTIDKGMVYISPTTDEVVPEPVIGSSFQLKDWKNSYEVEKIMIVW